MRISEMERMVAVAHAKTARSGLSHTRAALGKLMPLLSQWNGSKDFSDAVEAVETSHKRDIEEIGRKRNEAEAALARAHEMDGGALHHDSIDFTKKRSMCVKIAPGNVPVFSVYQAPKSHETNIAALPWLAFWAGAGITFVVKNSMHGQGQKAPDTAREVACMALVGGIAFAVTKIVSAIARFNQFTPKEFDHRVAEASAAVQSALIAINQELGGESDTGNGSEK